MYVDDLAIVSLESDEHSLHRSFISALEKRWNVEDEGDLTDLLGIEFTREGGIVELRANQIHREVGRRILSGWCAPYVISEQDSM